MENQFDSLVKVLLSADPNFFDWWEKMGESKQREVVQKVKAIENIIDINYDETLVVHRWCSQLLIIPMTGTDERDLKGTEIPQKWPIQISDESWRENSLNYSRAYLSNILTDSAIEIENFYGGIKKNKQIKMASNESLGAWDIVRFRIIGKGLREVQLLSNYLIRKLGNDCLRIRNTYVNPPLYLVDNGYRAIHLVVRIENTHLVEIQIRTESRDIIGWLDHRLYLNKDVDISEDLSAWLRLLSYKANLCDLKNYLFDISNKGI